MAKNVKSNSVFDVTDIIPDTKPEKTTTESVKVSETPTVAAKKKGDYGTKRAYYFTDDIIRAINLKAATDNVSRNDVVVSALRIYLAEYLK